MKSLPGYLREEPEPLEQTPIVDDDEDVLPFLRVRWRNFERLNLAVAERCDGLRDAVEHGRAGQDQEGIDFVGRLPSGGFGAYQVRRLTEAPTANSVRKAVDEFLVDRPMDAGQFVLCTARRAGSPAILKEVKLLGEEHPDLDIRVRGAERLSVILAEHPDLVLRFFNEQYRDRLCGRPSHAVPSSTPPEVRGPSVEALLRGPIKTLKLEAVLSEAETAADPRQRAAAYSELSARLAAGPYHSFSRRMRERQADELLASGELEAACEIWLEITAELIEAGLASFRPQALFRALDHIPEAAEALRARLDAAQTRIGWEDGSSTGLEKLHQSLKHLSTISDRWVPRVSLWWAECALVDERFDEIRAAADQLRATASATPYDDISVRLRLAIADVTADWPTIVREARVGLLAPADAGLVFARHGRILAWTGDPLGSIDAYRQALEPLMRADLQGDVRACLDSIWRVQVIYGPLTEAGATAALMPTIVSGRTRYGAAHARRSALNELHKQRWPQAQEELRRFLWESRVSGHLENELRGRELMGDLYARTGEFAAAAGNYIRCGAVKEARDAAKAVSDPLNVSPELESGPPWMVAAALAVVAEDGDRRSEEEAGQIGRIALSLINGLPQSVAGPQVWQEAFGAIAGLIVQLPEELVGATLDVVGPLIPREPDQYRRIDDHLLAVLEGVYDAHPRFAGRARAALLNAIGQSGLSDGASGILGSRVSEDSVLRKLLEERASSGDRWAARVLAGAGIDHPAAVAYAEDRAAAFLARPPHSDSTTVGLISGAELLGSITGLLGQARREAVARHLLAHAEASTDMEANRAAALRGLSQLAATMSAERRDEFFGAVLRLAQPDMALSPFDVFAREMQHPLSRVRISLGIGWLHRSAVLAAASFARTSDQIAVVKPYLEQFLKSAEEADLNTAAQLLLILEPIAGLLVDIGTLGHHHSHHLRGAAVWLLTHGKATDPALSQSLVLDVEVAIRLGMARSLAELTLHDAALAVDLAKVLATDTSARIRNRAAVFLASANAVAPHPTSH